MNGYRPVEMAVYGGDVPVAAAAADADAADDDDGVIIHGDIFVALHPFSLATSPTQ